MNEPSEQDHTPDPPAAGRGGCGKEAEVNGLFFSLSSILTGNELLIHAFRAHSYPLQNDPLASRGR